MIDLEAIFGKDNFLTVSFEEVLPHLEKYLLRYMSLLQIKKGPRPQTDGKSIMLPAAESEFPDPKDEGKDWMFENRNVCLYVSSLLHELLHIRELSFGIDFRPYFNTFDNPKLAHAIWNIADDARIEHNAQAYFSKNDLQLLANTNQHYTGKMQLPEDLGARIMQIYSSRLIAKGMPSKFFEPDRDKAAKKQLAAREKMTLDTAIDNAELNAVGINNVNDLIDEMIRISDSVYGEPVQASLAVVPKIYELLKKAIPNIEKSFTQKPEVDESDDNNKITGVYVGLRGDGHDFSKGEKKGSDLGKLLGNYKTKITPDSQSTAQEEKEDGSTIKVKTFDLAAKDYAHVHILKYVENSKFSNRIDLRKYEHLIGRITGTLQMMIPNEMEMVRYSRQPGQLNMEAVIRLMADPRNCLDTAIYDSFLINTLNTEWFILIDRSGSTVDLLDCGKTVLDIEKDTAAIVYEGITRAHDSFADKVHVYTFHTDGDCTYLEHHPSIAHLSAMHAEGNNADGVAIRGATYKLNQLEAAEKNLIVISDGFPSASGFANYDAYEDTAMAFLEAERLGIRTLYFNIAQRPPKRFEDIVKNCTFAQSIPSVYPLPEAVTEIVRRLL